MKSTESRLSIKIVAIVFSLAIGIRLILFSIYGPVSYSDTPSYRRLAEAVINGFQRYDGTRTPGYPIFLALVGSDTNVYITQLILGALTTLLLLWIGWRLTGNTLLAVIIAVFHSLNLGQLFFEANLLTETLTTFLIVLSLAGVLYWVTNRKQKRIWIAIGIGLASSLAALTRPLFIYLPFLLFIVLVWHSIKAAAGETPRLSIDGGKNTAWFRHLSTWRVMTPGIALLIPAALILGSWISFIHTRYHMWSLSTMTGYHMVQHTGNFFEYLPDDYADLRDTYLEFRQAHIDEFGTQTNTIWEAIPEMQKVSGLTFYDLSRTLSRLSTWLITHYPGMYLSNVLKGWWLFWRAPVYWQPEAFQWRELAEVTNYLVLAERGLLVIANLIFVFVSLPALWSKRLMPDEFGRRLFIICLVGCIWIGSVVQTLVDHGDNPRFLVPMQSLVILWVLWFTIRMWQTKRNKS